MGWALFQEVPECPESHNFPFEVFLTQRVQRERMEGRERMNQPVTMCISFYLGDRSQVLPPAVPPCGHQRAECR